MKILSDQFPFSAPIKILGRILLCLMASISHDQLQAEATASQELTDFGSPKVPKPALGPERLHDPAIIVFEVGERSLDEKPETRNLFSSGWQLNSTPQSLYSKWRQQPQSSHNFPDSKRLKQGKVKQVKKGSRGRPGGRTEDDEKSMRRQMGLFALILGFINVYLHLAVVYMPLIALYGIVIATSMAIRNKNQPHSAPYKQRIRRRYRRIGWGFIAFDILVVILFLLVV